MSKASLKGLTSKQVGLIVAVLFIYFFCPTQGIFSCALGEISASYPDVPQATLTYLITINNIMAIFAAFFFGLWAGRRFKFKTLAIIALLFFSIGGGLPVFLPQDSPFWILFVTRAILGLGRGCFIPIVQITLSAMFEEEKTRSAWFGIGSIFFNIGGTLGISIAGILAVFDWRYCFAFYLFAAIPLVLYAIFFKEEDVKDYIATADTGFQTFKFPAVCWIYFILYALSIVISQVMFIYGGLAMTQLGISTVHTGFAMSAFTIAASLVGLVFTFIFRCCKNYIIALGIGIMAVGMFLFYSACLGSGTLVLFYAGAILLGMGCAVITIGCPLSMSLSVPAAAVAAALSFNEVFHNCGSFLATPWGQLVFAIFPNKDISFIFLATTVLAIVLLVVALIVGTKIKHHRAAIDMQEASNNHESLPACEQDKELGNGSAPLANPVAEAEVEE